MIEYGFLTSDEEKIIKKDMASVTTRQSTNHHAFTNEFVSSFNEVTLVHTVARAYLTVKKDGQLLTVHSNYQAGGSKLFATDLFISEYIEGSSNNKAIEIFNGTGNSVDLSAYKVNLYGNGSETATDSLQLNGILAHGEVYVIYNSGAIQAIKDVGDVSSSVTFYNGDDALALVKNDVVIDAFGIIGSDPGTSWTVGSGATAEFTLVRKVSVTGPTTTWDTNEWDVYPQDTTSYLGDHDSSFGVLVNDHPMINGYTNKTILIGSTTFDYLDGISAMDDTDSVLNVHVYVENSLEEDVTNVDVSELPVGVYTVEISTTNTFGNATSVTYTLTINTGNAPVISGTSNISILVDDVLDLMDGVTASDFEDGVLTGSITTSILDEMEQSVATIDTSIEGVYTVTYSVTDSHGNLTSSNITVTVSTSVVEPTIVLQTTIDFGTLAKTGYAAGTFTFTNGDATNYTLTKDRAQINTSTSAPHTSMGGFLVLAPISTTKVSYVEFNLNTYTSIAEISFDISSWSATSLTNANALDGNIFALQYYNPATLLWETLTTKDLLSNLMSSVVSNAYTTVTYEVPAQGLYRIYYNTPNASSTTNTQYALTADNFKIYSYSE